MTCDKCDNGRIVTDNPPGEPFELESGAVAQVVGGYSSHLCGCRRSLPPREGDASWWTMNVALFERDAEIFSEAITIKVTTELPVSEDNYPLVRKGNRYYPTMIEVGSRTLTVPIVQDIIAALTEAVKIAEATDAPDTEPACGHWAPCDCKRATAPTSGQTRTEDAE